MFPKRPKIRHRLASASATLASVAALHDLRGTDNRFVLLAIAASGCGSGHSFSEEKTLG